MSAKNEISAGTDRTRRSAPSAFVQDQPFGAKSAHRGTLSIGSPPRGRI
jgi:hypothetical protein